ncbi:hypothetical protein [Halosegnis longus]|uniref:TRAM domain-containing protein n=1 Tax=Halosegnis longus TaxID=2216012 RepID=A0AAJ4RAG6_9EURY|nr:MULTISPECIES: hypothetical protein [Halobacteriales]RNJ27207.1 hypothetical protein Nmn1133_11335 [Salella cibi]
MVEPTTIAAAVGGLVVLAGIAALLGGNGDDKYDDPEAQAAHEQAQQRDPSDVAPVGSEHTTVVQELVDGGETARVSIQGLYVFVEDIPSDVSKNDTIDIKITDHGPDGTSGRATFLGRD